ncbi:4-deoxy-L-threo-5-hexosulose-uronate ketol-isomerase [Vibrio aerogenes CECT 7868]|uniref:4-deoxy-L-threo-5-hexosulose-uronate ketol-isomerase n=1 Tax=Vibrio aerogenes CECT 7868 TaxID=1216006 RepID=A0A1M5ZH22_9VIBR|nr:5-dehydro-4-deoxy-D-glucuronate isomerase [Vibrio aerogenes]SHI23566.1 4-deoxy-L-threo-5-hexosulose-uronate ketol-isomerase [Vibrio aerogenes CECT 7868]
MRIHHNSHPEDAKNYDTSRLREEFLTEALFLPGEINIVYSHIDRMVAMGVCPEPEQTLALDHFVDSQSFGTTFFLERRELGIVNLGTTAEIRCHNGLSYRLEYLDALYLGQGEQAIEFTSLDQEQSAKLYCLSAPAHHSYPSRIIQRDQANQIELGTKENANERLITQYLHPEILPTCQLCMGITHLKTGSVWNTMPAHTHERRMEAYFYFNLDPSQVVFHLMGEPDETRHIVVRNHQLILSPSWSIHSGCGTQNYSFVWGMAGENQTFDDMDFVSMDDIR